MASTPETLILPLNSSKNLFTNSSCCLRVLLLLPGKKNLSGSGLIATSESLEGRFSKSGYF